MATNFRRSLEEELYIGIGEHDRADIPALEHNTTISTENPLALNHGLANIRTSCNRGRQKTDLRCADLCRDILTIQQHTLFLLSAFKLYNDFLTELL